MGVHGKGTRFEIGVPRGGYMFRKGDIPGISVVNEEP
jgi:hypothetical protein